MVMLLYDLEEGVFKADEKKGKNKLENFTLSIYQYKEVFKREKEFFSLS